MMNKWTIFIAIFLCSFIFVLLQAFMYGFLDNWNITVSLNLIKTKKVHSNARRKNEDIKAAVSDFMTACSETELEVALIDQRILEHLEERIEKYSKDGRTDADKHWKCHYFCSQNVITFGMFKQFQENNEWEKFSMLVGAKGFKTELLSSPDYRSAKLENVGQFPQIKTHAVIYRKRAVIHVVFFHERNGQYWSSTCEPNTSNRKLGRYWQLLKRNPFCSHQHVLPRLLPAATSMDGLKLKVPLYLKKFLKHIKESTFVPCDLSQARKFYSKYGFDQSSDAEIFRLKAKNLLSYVKHSLDQLGVPFWLSSGTCLGWFRQCDFIPHSKDVDIGIWIKDYNPKISHVLQEAGLVPKHIFGKVQDSFELSFRTPSNDLKLDIFFFYEEGDSMWNGGTQAKTGKKFKYLFPKFSLCWTEFVDIFVRVPCNTLDYIKANYGPNWQILIKEWDWKKSPSNVKENGQWSANELSKVVQVFQ